MKNNAQPIFITGTDTGVGKSVISAALLKGLMQGGSPAAYWKPIQAGLAEKDCDYIERSTGLSALPSAQELPLAASPDQGLKAIDQPGFSAEVLAGSIPTYDGMLIIEGAGGVFVPVNTAAETWIDVLNYWRCPTVVVARTGLGTLNHTVMTVNTLRDHGHYVAAVILSGKRHRANEDSLKRLLPAIAFHWFPEQLDSERLDSKDCCDLGEFLLTNLEDAANDTPANDNKYIWHPYTQHQNQQEPTELVGAYGPWVVTASGEKLIDATSSWWVNTIGHGREEIRSAISHQQAKMDHVIFANATHAPGVQLGKKLVALSAGALDRVFYSDNGSTAVEVGLKIAFQACRLRGETRRKKFLTLDGGYHGDTIGTMSVGGSDGFHSTFADLMFPTERIAPVTSHSSSVCVDGPASRQRSLQQLENHLRDHHQDYVGFVLEPLVQGAGGMLFHDLMWLKKAIQICKEHNLYIILDEVFTGLGRVGRPFAFQRADIAPDIVCIAKGLTGGTMPLSATLTTQSLFEEFLSSEKSNAFFHGHSYTGNPIACAAALATLDIFNDENLPDRAMQMEHTFLTWLDQHGQNLKVVNGRAIGGILAMEWQSNIGDYFAADPNAIAQVARQYGLFLRPLGNTIYLVLPLTIRESDLKQALEGLKRTLENLAK